MSEDVAGSLLLLDMGAGECASTCLDFGFWADMGAKNVCALEAAAAAAEGAVWNQVSEQ